MPTLQDSLESEENVIEQFVGIKYQHESYNCAVTNLKVLLYREEKQQSITLEYKSIETISFEKEWYIDLFYFSLFSFALAFVFIFVSLIIYLPLSLPAPQVWPPADAEFLSAFLYPGIVLAISGGVAVLVYFIIAKFSLLISGPKGDFRLFSNSDSLLKLNLIIKNMKSGRTQPLKQEESFEFPDFMRIISNIIIGISVFLTVLIGWLRTSVILRNLFYIPFFLLLIGFLMALLSYNEKKIKKNYFKLGILLIFLGLNCTWFQIHISTLPVIGFAILVVGALLFFDSFSIG